jgi:NTE family protein
MRRALVLGGGGVAGIAWEIGVLAGLAEFGLDVARDADVVIGTSAGATVAAQLERGVSLAELYERQLAPTHIERDPPVTAGDQPALSMPLAGGSLQDAWRHIGAGAVAARTVPESVRHQVIAARLPSRSWPDRPMMITAVSTGGEFEVFDRNSGVALVDAVAASCAVPGVWPPVTIGDHRYMDGGVRSLTNADLADGCDIALVVSPVFLGMTDTADAELATVAVPSTYVVRADAATVAAVGSNVLDPATRAPAAVAGRAIAARVVGDVGAIWRAHSAGSTAKPPGARTGKLSSRGHGA